MCILLNRKENSANFARRIMGVSLSKGGNVSLSKMDPGLEKVMIGLGWNARSTDGEPFDLDSSAFLLIENGKVRTDQDFIFYNQRQSPCGAVIHSGDNRTGLGEGDDEMLMIELHTIPQEVVKIPFCVTIHEAESRRQNFGMVSGAFIRIVNTKDNEEMARYDLSEDASIETAMIFGELYRHNDEWKFRAVGQGYEGGLTSLAHNFGVGVG